MHYEFRFLTFNRSRASTFISKTSFSLLFQQYRNSIPGKLYKLFSCGAVPSAPILEAFLETSLYASRQEAQQKIGARTNFYAGNQREKVKRDLDLFVDLSLEK